MARNKFYFTYLLTLDAALKLSLFHPYWPIQRISALRDDALYKFTIDTDTVC